VRDFITGVRYFFQGFGLLIRRPRLLLLGMLPAVLTTVVLLGAMIALIANIGHLAALVTPFANGWPSGARQLARLAAEIAMIVTAVVLGIVGFTALTLTIGGPFYERIAERIEDDLGVTVQRFDRPEWQQFLSGARDGIVLTLRSAIWSVPLFAAGFVPVVGQSAVRSRRRWRPAGSWPSRSSRCRSTGAAWACGGGRRCCAQGGCSRSASACRPPCCA
jgi:CysZ protein